MKIILKQLKELCLFITVFSSGFPVLGQEIIRQGFDNGFVLDSSWVITAKDTTSSDANSGIKMPAIKFAKSGQYLITPEFNNAGNLSFWAKGYATDSISAFVIQYFDSSDWLLLDSISNIFRSAKTYNYELPKGACRIKITYYKSVGNLYFDDLVISKPTEPPLLIKEKTCLAATFDYSSSIRYKTDKPGKLFYLVIGENCQIPSVNEVITPKLYANSCIADSGNIHIADTTNGILPILGLQPETSYTIYLVATGSKNNISVQTEMLSLAFKTIKKQNNLFFSEIIRGSGKNKAIEIFNPTKDTVSLNNYRIAMSTNGADWKTSFFTFKEGAKIAPLSVYVVVKSLADSTVIDFSKASETTSSSVLDFTGDDARGLQRTVNNGKTWFFIDLYGKASMPGVFSVAGEKSAAEKCNLIRKPYISDGNIDWTSSAGTDSINSEWILQGINTFTNLGQHNYISPTKLVMGLVQFVAQKNDPVVDSLNHTIVAFLKAGTDINNVAWSMDIDKNINITPMPEKVNNFSKPVCFVLTSVDGKESTSWTISVKVEKETSLFESGIDALKIWPNPAFNYLHINSEISIKKVKIANVGGQIVKTTVIKDGMINVAGITEGTYTLIVIKSDNTILYTHFVKLK